MNILFICGSLEQGKNGVGDYTRILSEEIAKRGNNILLVAYNDPYVLIQTEEVINHSDADILVFRLPGVLDEKKRIALLKQAAYKFKPDLISLQYVPYSYSKLGIPLLLGVKMKKIYSASDWHLMVHEPYLRDLHSSKEYLIQIAQKIALFLVAKTLKTKVIHTSIKEYQKLLSKIFLTSKILGLFGNIPVYSYADCEKQNANHINLTNDVYTAVYFGAAPKRESHLEIAGKIKDFCQKTGIRIDLTICGKSSSLAESFAGTIKEQCESKCNIIMLGELSEKELSKIFCSSDFGVARTPPMFLGKSGSSMAMLEHNLPLWIPLNKNEPLNEYLSFQADICFYDIEDLSMINRDTKMQKRLSAIATTMLADLQLH